MCTAVVVIPACLSAILQDVGIGDSQLHSRRADHEAALLASPLRESNCAVVTTENANKLWSLLVGPNVCRPTSASASTRL